MHGCQVKAKEGLLGFANLGEANENLQNLVETLNRQNVVTKVAEEVLVS